MMHWKKKGQIFCQKMDSGWRANSALTPTPFILDEDTVRIYAGFRDNEGISRIGYVDLDAHDLTKIKAISESPVLDIGRAGCFDDNGVILGDVVRVNNQIRMYYVGFQLVKRAKFLAFSGLAESNDNGESFSRISEAPILDRANQATTIRAIHSVLYEDGRWRIWYAAGDDWQLINGKSYPKYNIWYTESADGIHFPNPSTLCIDVRDKEYRIGRPSVFKHEHKYYMFYTKGSISGEDYFPGLGISNDGVLWTRNDEYLGLSLSPNQFDSMHLCYPRLFSVKNKTYCVYNGNNMGLEGFGLAELIEW